MLFWFIKFIVIGGLFVRLLDLVVVLVCWMLMIAVLLLFGISCLCVLHFVVSLLFVLGVRVWVWFWVVDLVGRLRCLLSQCLMICLLITS